MTAVVRMAMLDLRTVAPYRYQGLLVFGIVALIDVKSPVALVPALILLVTSQIAAYPFNIADKADLETLYAVLPVPRRTVLYGHYTWAMASFLVTATAGTTLAFVLARVQGLPFGVHTVATMLTLAWVLFAVNVAIQFPLLIRYGYTRISVLGTILPLALIMLAIIKLHLTLASVQLWTPVLGAAGVAAFVASAAASTALDRRRVHSRPPTHAGRG